MRISWLRKLENRVSGVYIPYLTQILIGFQVLAFIANWQNPEFAQVIVLQPNLVFAGEWWRVFSFLAYPPLSHPIFAFFFWYIFYLMGTALEREWGGFRYNFFLFAGYIFTLAAAFAFPERVATNTYLQGSVFLAFAYLYPDFQLMLFFILPVKIKWLALLAWAGYAFNIVVGDMASRFMTLAAVGNFFVFFGLDLWRKGRARLKPRMQPLTPKAILARDYLHRCSVCGKTDLSHPYEDFRYVEGEDKKPICLCEEHRHEYRQKKET